MNHDHEDDDFLRSLKAEPRRIYIDIDSTICTQTHPYHHERAQPLVDRIEMANKLYDQGHHIVYWTARGSRTGIDWYKLTKKQLEEWGVKHHELKMGKPAFDILIDDRAINSLYDWTEESVNKVIYREHPTPQPKHVTQ